jgi:hypothetical protein
MARRIHLDHINMAPFGYRNARLALAARVYRRPARPIGPDAIQRLGNQPSGRGFANPANARHQESMSQPVALNRIGERADHRLLPDQLAKTLGPVFASQNAVGLVGLCRSFNKGLNRRSVLWNGRWRRSLSRRLSKSWLTEHRILTRRL